MTTNNGVNGTNGAKGTEEVEATQEVEVMSKKVAINTKEFILEEILKGEFDFSESIKFDGKLYIKHGEETFKLNLIKCKKEVDFEKMAKNQEKIDKKVSEIEKLQAQISKLKRV